MIEALTPQLMMISLFVIIASSALLTLLLSLLLLWRYRRAVVRVMQREAGFEADGNRQPPIPARDAQPALGAAGPDPATGCCKLLRMPLRGALSVLVACTLFALLFSWAAQQVYPGGQGAAGFFVGLWIYLWPAVIALQLILPVSAGRQLLLITLYLLVFSLLGWWFAQTPNLPGYRLGGLSLEARSTANPVTLARLWLVVNLAPTLLVWVCLSRRLRAVAPLLLALTTTVVAGLLTLYYAVFSPAGVDLYVELAVSLELSVIYPLLATLVLALFLFGGLGWLLISRVARAYRNGRLSDQALLLDALMLLFASYYGLWLSAGGAIWFLTVPVAFGAFSLVLALIHRSGSPDSAVPRGLTFLRVFSLGERSDRLLHDLSIYWRYLGSVQLIAGPDVAGSTVQPHQFLDFLAGRLQRHFIHDHVSMERSLAQQDFNPDSDGRFRINSFFCYEDVWRSLLPRLVGAGDIVLMDLRSFSARNAGCIHELQLLAREVPVSRALLIVDGTTDLDFLGTTLEQAWRELPTESVNRQYSPEQMPRHLFSGGSRATRELMGRLCTAAWG